MEIGGDLGDGLKECKLRREGIGMDKNEKDNNLGGRSFPWGILLGFLGTVLVAYLGYLSTRSQIELPIRATQTAAANSAFSPLPGSSTASHIEAIPISIEDFPGEIFNFSGNGGYSELHVIHGANDDFDYLFYYNMPETGDAYAGIFFRFTPTVNFTEFAFLQLIVSFGDENAVCEIYLEDQVGGKSYIALWNNKLVNASEDARIEVEGNNRVFTIPLAGNFLDVPNKQSIAGIGISINTTVIRGSHSCTIQEIDLLK
jgi:hypothetical protein